jgi:hypothetical protein
VLVPVLFYVTFAIATISTNSDTVSVFKWTAIVFGISMDLLWCISGAILVRSVYQIRDFFKRQNAEDFINTKMLIKHALTFGTFLIMSLIFIASQIADFLINNEVTGEVANITAVVF